MKIYFLFYILIITNINISAEENITESIKIYSEELFQVSCDSNFFYLSMKISSDREIISPMSFELNLVSPTNLRMKCMIFNTQFECFSFVPDGSVYRQEELFFNIFYTPPKIRGIDFDLKSFRKNSRRWENTTMCGTGNYLLNDTTVDFTLWKKIKLNYISGEECKYNYTMDREQKNELYFNMSLDIEDENLIKLLKENNDEGITFIQEIKAPISLQYQDYTNPIFIPAKDYAFCRNNDLINSNNYQNINFLCVINIPRKKIINSEIKLHSFFDKIYIKSKISNEIKTLNIFINSTTIGSHKILNNTVTTIQKHQILKTGKANNNILCPNLPIFTIKNKNTGIYYDSYNNKTNRFYFYLKGILTNGYKYTNNSLVKLSLTNKEISFDLFLKDNSFENFTEVQSKCILSSNSFYNEEDTLIKCFGMKTFPEEKNENILIDLNLNYVRGRNNIFNDVIINWPEKQYFGKVKNFYSVKIYALSIKRKYSVCEEGNFFTFYINIYDVNKEIKIIFDLPLLEPEGYVATCELFDVLTLVCTIDLRYKKIFKFERISLPEKDKEIRIINEEGNEIIFTVNDQNNFIKMEEDCGENVVFGAMKEMGISKKKGIAISIGFFIFLICIIGFCIFYVIHRIKRCRKKRGKRLATTEESKVQKEPTKEPNI